ncbi:unnamed protein product [Effrenium voratum]|nr:unnamed protein product [Effrenium voratum]
MTKMKAETKDKCYMKTIEYSMRKEDQQKEREAIASAVTTLKQEESGGKNAAGATSFLQMNSAHKTRSDDKRDTVRNAVALMQHQTRAKAAGMGKAAEAVLGLIDAIKSHQAEDSKRKRFCEAQLGSNEDAKAKLQGELTRLKARQDFLGSEVGTLGTQVEEI